MARHRCGRHAWLHAFDHDEPVGGLFAHERTPHRGRVLAALSCAKPSYIKLQTAWVSDRTVCYLASGKPAVVQDTGPSAILPNGEGIFRFSTMKQAAKALGAVNSDYKRHSEAARQIVETYFDAKKVIEQILGSVL